jgi:hypothetical protein
LLLDIKYYFKVIDEIDNKLCDVFNKYFNFLFTWYNFYILKSHLPNEKYNFYNLPSLDNYFSTDNFLNVNNSFA